ncbi:glutamine synthetase family protein [Frigidibacter sp. MR17.24]|uniref:glutamine synthetase family protein n=1 Tax=Frigidibacter sp. MR17.24 TaxID=3127345 RepID=UPI0030130D5D
MNAAARLEGGSFPPEGISDVHVGIFDLDATFRHKQVGAKKAAKLLREGYAFCDVIHAWDSAEVTWDDGDAYGDRPCELFADTLRLWPFGPGAAVCLADFTGDYGERSPRRQAARQVARAAAMGFDVTAAFEFEFFVLDETDVTLREKRHRDLTFLAPGNRTYSLQTAALHADLFDGLKAVMADLAIPLDSLHTELGPGCFEAPLGVARGLRAADDAALFRSFARAYLARRGLTPVFMSKLRPDLSGQSGHFHISLSDADGRPAFWDPEDADGLSATARHFIAGIVALAPELLAMSAHTVNAYRRMVPGAWAPTWANWGVQNRTCAVRAVRGGPSETRVEFRVSSADTNPHATMAMVLAAGLWGIETKAPCPAPIEGSAYALPVPPAAAFPRDLHEAAERLDRSAIARATFGDTFIDHFVRSRRVEAAAAARAVSHWEIERYLDLF